MSSSSRPPRINFDHPIYSVLEDGREPEMLWVGLSIADTAQSRKLVEGEAKPRKRRSLDDMRRLSEHIKSVTHYRGK